MAAERQSRMIERVRDRKGRHKERHFAFRIGFGIVGALVVLAGIALLVLPGPGTNGRLSTIPEARTENPAMPKAIR